MIKLAVVVFLLIWAVAGVKHYKAAMNNLRTRCSVSTEVFMAVIAGCGIAIIAMLILGIAFAAIALLFSDY